MINLDNIDAVDKWIDLHYQVVWSILFVLAGVRLRRNRKPLFLLSYSHFTLLVCRCYHYYYPKVLRILIDLKILPYTILLKNLKYCSICAEELSEFFHYDHRSNDTRSKFHCIIIPVNDKMEVTTFRR